MKLCGFALLAKGEIAKASKLAAKLVEKSLNEENTEKESGLVHLSISEIKEEKSTAVAQLIRKPSLRRTPTNRQAGAGTATERERIRDRKK